MGYLVEAKKLMDQFLTDFPEVQDMDAIKAMALIVIAENLDELNRREEIRLDRQAARKSR